MRNFIILFACIFGVTYLAFSDSLKLDKKNLAQSTMENQPRNEELPQSPGLEKINDSEKEPTLDSEGPTEEEDKIKREDEVQHYCETSPDDPQCQ